jgi:MOSC domain-containing protein YiiM
VPGTILGVGEQVLLQVTRYTSPCVNIRPAFLDGDYSRVSQKRNPGWSRVYARVLSEGTVRPGDAVRVLPPAEADAGLAPGPR